MIPFALVRTADDRVVGATSSLNLRTGDSELHPYAVEIGGTWLAGSAQRTGINLEAQFLLLSQAFEIWDVDRVDFKTDAGNDSARKALLALGAQFEGVRRNWHPSRVLGEQYALRYRDVLDSRLSMACRPPDHSRPPGFVGLSLFGTADPDRFMNPSTVQFVCIE